MVGPSRCTPTPSRPEPSCTSSTISTESCSSTGCRGPPPCSAARSIAERGPSARLDDGGAGGGVHHPGRAPRRQLAHPVQRAGLRQRDHTTTEAGAGQPGAVYAVEGLELL